MSVPAPPSQDRRQRRHSPKTMLLVQRMAEAGWTPTQTRRYLGGQGIDVSLTTIRRWTIPSEAQHHLEINRRQQRERMRRQRERRRYVNRMRELREAGLSMADIARVMNLDHPELRLSRSTVEAALHRDHIPRTLRAAASLGG